MKYIHTFVRLDLGNKMFADVVLPNRAMIRAIVWDMERSAVANAAGEHEMTLYPTLLIESKVGADREKRRFFAVTRFGEIDSDFFAAHKIRYVDLLRHPQNEAPILVYEAMQVDWSRKYAAAVPSDEAPTPVEGVPVIDDRPKATSGEIVQS